MVPVPVPVLLNLVLTIQTSIRLHSHALRHALKDIYHERKKQSDANSGRSQHEWHHQVLHVLYRCTIANSATNGTKSKTPLQTPYRYGRTTAVLLY
jgi:hypothetical protein